MKVLNKTVISLAAVAGSQAATSMVEFDDRQPNSSAMGNSTATASSLNDCSGSTPVMYLDEAVQANDDKYDRVGQQVNFYISTHATLPLDLDPTNTRRLFKRAPLFLVRQTMVKPTDDTNPEATSFDEEVSDPLERRAPLPEPEKGGFGSKQHDGTHLIGTEVTSRGSLQRGGNTRVGTAANHVTSKIDKFESGKVKGKYGKNGSKGMRATGRQLRPVVSYR